MESVAAVVGAGVVIFAGTNLDDFVVLAVLNAAASAGGRPKKWQIWVGQYSGVAILVLVSLLAALGLTLIPTGWTGVLGFLPLSLGVYRLIHAIRARANGAPQRIVAAGGTWGVIGLTLANGGDNLAAYPPYFRTLGLPALTLTLLVFAIGVAVWCALGALLVRPRPVPRAIRRWGVWIIPVVYMLIGLYVMYKGGLFSGLKY
ncbi:cadmium resistance transporter [Humibacter antri]